MFDTKPRVVVIYNRDFEGAEADPENKAREDIKGIAEHVISILESRAFGAVGLGITDDVVAAVSELREIRPDAVFNLCESIGGDNRFEPLLPLLMDREGVAYTGSNSLSLALALHKHKAKEILRARGVSDTRGGLPDHAGCLVRGHPVSADREAVARGRVGRHHARIGGLDARDARAARRPRSVSLSPAGAGRALHRRA